MISYPHPYFFNLFFKVNVNNVKNNERTDSSSSPKRMQRSSPDGSSSAPAVILDSLLAQHLGELLAYMHRSVSPRAILGMTVEQTSVSHVRKQSESVPVLQYTPYLYVFMWIAFLLCCPHRKVIIRNEEMNHCMVFIENGRP